MADGDVTTTEKNKWYNPANLLDGIQCMFGTDPDASWNYQGQAIWLAAAFYILGNSLGTNNTKRGVKRFGIGPVMIW